MAIIGRFIGINKYTDNRIKDLNGAVKDAQALYGIFEDSFQDINSELIIDEDATKSNIKKNFNTILEDANSDDFIIISLSGHGSNDHHIVTHDTLTSNFYDTSIKMEDIASSFKSSKAKNILIILDCCFSGGTTAKVFDNGFTSRSFSDPDFNYSGSGKVLITASGFDQPAFENLNTGHGLLTNALINVLTEKKDTIDLSTAMDTVLALIQAEATTIGCIQTPIAFNLINGSFKIKPLIKGDKYFSYFPDFSKIEIGDEIKELSKFNIPDEICNSWIKVLGSKLLPLQMSAINEKKVLDGNSLFVSAPTSSGKTFIGELASIKNILSGKKSVFLLPFKALVNEKYDQFVIQYQNEMNMRIIRCSGDYSDQISEFLHHKYDIAFFTYEMFLSIIVDSPDILRSIGSIIIDEVQFISDHHRGIVVELILTRLKLLKSSGINPQIITLSATIENINNFDNWLGLETLQQTTRPIPLRYGVIGRDGQFHYREYDDSTINTEQVLAVYQIAQRGQKRSSQDLLIPLCQKILEDPNSKILIFRNTRGVAEGCANYLGNNCGLTLDEDIIDELYALENTRTNQKLLNCVPKGVAFHNSNLTREERKIIEDNYRKVDSGIRILVSTSTLAAGINTPASHVIIVENGYPWENKEYSAGDVQNMVGRAGRLGLQEEGISYLLSDSNSQTQQLINKYINYQEIKLVSSFKPDQLFTWIIKLLAQVGKIEKKEISTLLSNTYGGYQQSIMNPDWAVNFQREIASLVDQMIQYSLIHEEDSLIELTLLGAACGKSSLTFYSCIQLFKTIDKIPPKAISGFELLSIVQTIEELDSVYISTQNRGNSDSKWVTQISRIINRGIVNLLQFNARDIKVYYKRCKKIYLLYLWINGISITNIENEFYSNPFNLVAYGDIQSIVNTNRYHFSSIHEIVFLYSPDKSPNEEEFEKFSRQLEFGIPTDSLDLVDLSLPRETSLLLITKGIKTKSQFVDKNNEGIVSEIIDSETYKAIIQNAV